MNKQQTGFFLERLGRSRGIALSVILGLLASGGAASAQEAGVEGGYAGGWIEDGAQAFVCDQLGFLAIVRNMDGTLSSPQFPTVRVEHSDGLFVFTEPPSQVNGIDVAFTNFLTFSSTEGWVLKGFEGTSLFAKSCTDITADLAFSFAQIAAAAPWGLPEVRERVALYDALEDDLRTRLELAQLENAELQGQNSEWEIRYAQASKELSEIRVSACSELERSQSLILEASSQADGAISTSELSGTNLQTDLLSKCLSEVTYVSSMGELAE